MTSTAKGYSCTGAQCVHHHYKTVEAEERRGSHLKYRPTPTCSACGGQGCQIGGILNCEWLPWRVKTEDQDRAIAENIARAEKRRQRRPWWERRRLRGIILANPQLTPREAIRQAPKNDPANCWCLPPPYYLFPPARGKCFPGSWTPAQVGLGDMWAYNPTGANCGAILEALGHPKPDAGW